MQSLRRSGRPANLFPREGFAGLVHAESAPPMASRPTAGEWAIGVAFVLGALAFVTWIAWNIATL